MTVGVKIDVLQVLGNYSFRTWLSSARGASNTTLTELYAFGLAKLEVARDGYLEATDIDLDLSVTDIDVNLENPGVVGKILQGAMNSIGTLVFDTFKPYFMSMINTQVLGDLNKNLRSLPKKHRDFPETFPNSLSPLDYGIAEVRKLVRLNGFDPHNVKDFQHSTGIMNLDVTHIWVKGLATFHRIGNISVSMENNTVHFEMAVGTQQLEGQCNWEVSMMGLMSTLGTLKFTIDYLEVVSKVNQSLDTRKSPNLEELKITLGNFQLQFDGAGTLDYVIEALINILPNLLRYQIMLAVEEPLKMKVQEIFNEIDVEKQIKDQVQKMESSGGVNDTPPNSKPPPEEGLTIDESQLDDSIF